MVNIFQRWTCNIWPRAGNYRSEQVLKQCKKIQNSTKESTDLRIKMTAKPQLMIHWTKCRWIRKHRKPKKNEWQEKFANIKDSTVVYVGRTLTAKGNVNYVTMNVNGVWSACMKGDSVRKDLMNSKMLKIELQTSCVWECSSSLQVKHQFHKIKYFLLEQITSAKSIAWINVFKFVNKNPNLFKAILNLQQWADYAKIPNFQFLIPSIGFTLAVFLIFDLILFFL